MSSESPSGETKTVFVCFLLVGIIIPTLLKGFGYSGQFWLGAFNSFSGLAYYLFCRCALSKWRLSLRNRFFIFVTWLPQFVWLIINVLNGTESLIEGWYGYASFLYGRGQFCCLIQFIVLILKNLIRLY